MKTLQHKTYVNKDFLSDVSMMRRETVNCSADICLIPSHSEVRKGEVNILTRSHTLNISSKFKNVNSAFFRHRYVLLLNLMLEVFVSATNEDGIYYQLSSLSSMCHNGINIHINSSQDTKRGGR